MRHPKKEKRNKNKKGYIGHVQKKAENVHIKACPWTHFPFFGHYLGGRDEDSALEREKRQS